MKRSESQPTDTTILTNWDRLSNWIGKRFDDFRLLRRVRIEAAEWRKHRGHIWPHESLIPVNRMRDNLEPRLSRVERAFIRPESGRLLKKIRNPATTHQERAKIGDPRPGVGLRENGLPDIVWCHVGATGRSPLQGVEGTFPVEPFYIARYPVTYIQYRCFLEAKDGYGAAPMPGGSLFQRIDQARIEISDHQIRHLRELPNSNCYQ